jgi:hypothetical protein
MPDNELDIPHPTVSSSADGHVDSSGTGIATAAHDTEDLEPNKGCRCVSP